MVGRDEVLPAHELITCCQDDLGSYRQQSFVVIITPVSVMLAQVPATQTHEKHRR